MAARAAFDEDASQIFGSGLTPAVLVELRTRPPVHLPTAAAVALITEVACDEQIAARRHLVIGNAVDGASGVENRRPILDKLVWNSHPPY